MYEGNNAGITRTPSRGKIVEVESKRKLRVWRECLVGGGGTISVYVCSGKALEMRDETLAAPKPLRAVVSEPPR